MSQTTPPRLPDAPNEYNRLYMDGFSRILSSFFARLTAVGLLRGSGLNLDLDTLPTEADVATLRTGDVYRDTTASNVLKIKT